MHGQRLFDKAMSAFGRLTDEYERVYHEGIAWGPLGKVHLERGEGYVAPTSPERALDHYEKAESLDPKATHPILRCVRVIQSNSVFRDAISAPHSRESHPCD